MRQRGSILVGVLWCVALLSVIVIGVLHTARLDLMVVKNHGDKIQAHYFALAGIEKGKAVIYHDMLNRRATAKNHSGQLHDNPKDFGEVTFGRGRFRVYRPAQSHEGSGMLYGVADEESRLNINTASAQELAKLNGMTPDVVAAIQDWRDPDNAISPSGAEAEYYAALVPPRMPRNGPMLTIRELLMVRGVTPDLLWGMTAREPRLDDLETAGSDAAVVSTGWAPLITVHSIGENLNASGNERVNIQNATETQLTGIKGITPEIAKAIIAKRGQEQFKSIADLLEVTAPQQGGAQGANANRSTQATGPALISEDLFIEIADEIAFESEEKYSGLININTASPDVLTCLDGITLELAQAIVAHRSSSGFFANTAALLKVPGMNRNLFKQVAPRLTARSETFRILSEGRVESSGARQRIEAIVHVSRYNVQTLSYREDL